VPKDIQFPDNEPHYVFERDCLAFRALADGKPVECLVSAELLMHRFGAREFTEQALRQAFARHRGEIQAIARHHIEMGWVNPDNRLLLTTRFTTLTVKYGEDLRKSPPDLQVAQTATRLLAELIGPGAGAVNVEFDWEEKDGRPLISVMLTDANGMASDWLYPQDSGLMSRLRLWLNRLWGDFLQIRSQKLLQRFG
jgi:hypothetical protein